MQPSKHITLGYNLKKKYLPSEAVKEDHSLDQYIDYLKQEGIWVHPSIKPAMFSLTNGLLYPGLKTETELSGTHVLVKIPRSMILTTKKANIPELQKLFEQKFYSNSHENWEDRIIITFLLYTYAKKEESLWMKMVENLSRDIDILRFWPQQDIKLLKDPKADIICSKYRTGFEYQFGGFMEVIKKYPGLIDSQYLTKQNYKWLYTHLVSRSFGGYLEHVTMVPFCQLFNHHNSDVLYDFVYDESNPLKHKQTAYDSPQKYATQESRAEVESSDGSYNSEQYFDDDEFDYSTIEIHKIKWGGKISFSLKDKETVQIENKYKQLDEWLEQQLSWNDHSIIFVAQIVEKLNITKNEYMAGRKKFPESIASFAKLKQTCQIYKMKLEDVYKLFKGEKFQYRTLLEPEKVDPPPLQRFNDDKFDYFTMRMNKRDHFSANNQVYFCYGRLSNRIMLERYGMALQGNKYDHVWVSLPIIPYIQGYPDTIQKMQNKQLSVKRKFKLKRREINLELLVFYRMWKWDLMRHNINNIFKVLDLEKEIECLDLCIKLVQSEMVLLQEASKLEEKLKDSNIGYHQYFGIVYQLQHRTILDLHFRAYSEMKNIVGMLMKGEKIKEIMERMDGTQEEREMKWYLTKYSLMIQQS